MIWRYFLWLGTVGFGGPIALVGYMHRDLVERRGWISEQEYQEGLALAQIAPGPLAAQLAIYIGWLRAGVWGATLAGAAFVAPSFLMVLALSVAYTAYGGLPWIQGAFYGIGAAVIAVIARSAVKLTRATLKRDRLLWGLWLVSAVTTVATERELVTVVVLCGLVALLARGRAQNRAPTAAVLVPFAIPIGSATPAGLLAYFTYAGFFVFGSGLAIVPFLYGGVVRVGWLTEQQFLDAVAVSMITPGPVVITVAFIGYLVGGFAGALAAAVGIFAPVWIVTVLAAPHVRKLMHRKDVAALVAGVTAAAVGAIAGAALVLGRRALSDAGAVVIFGIVLGVLLLKRRPPEAAIIAAAGGAGILLR